MTGAADATARMRWIDGAKGIGILLVVYAHAARAHFATGDWPAWAQAADRLIYSFHMALFFVVAGVFAWPSLAKGRGRFVADRLRTIVYPYFLWSLVSGGLEVALADRVNTPLSLGDLALLPVAPIDQYWFLYALFLSLMVALACYPHRLALAPLAIVALLVAARFGAGPIVPRTCAYFPFVAIGILAAAPLRAIGRDRRTAMLTLLAATGMFAIGQLLAPADAVALPTGPEGAGLAATVAGMAIAVAGSVAALAAASLLDAGPAGAPLALLGRASLAIFVMHTLFSAGTRMAIKATEIVPPGDTALAATFAAGVLGPLAAWLVARRLGIATLAGFGGGSWRTAPAPGLFAPASRGVAA